MVTIFDVAYYILQKLPNNPSAMKLQRLCYYTQAWTLAWEDEPLFEEEFRAWDSGPTCEELFDITESRYIVNKYILEPYVTTTDLDDDVIESLDIIIKDYGNMTSHLLSELTRKEKPWKEASRFGSRHIISKISMAKYYSDILSEEEKGQNTMNITTIMELYTDLSTPEAQEALRNALDTALTTDDTQTAEILKLYIEDTPSQESDNLNEKEILFKILDCVQNIYQHLTDDTKIYTPSNDALSNLLDEYEEIASLASTCPPEDEEVEECTNQPWEQLTLFDTAPYEISDFPDA